MGNHKVCLVSQSCPTLSDPHGLEPSRFLCPWDFSGENTGVGCHFLLQGIFLTKGSNPHVLCVLHLQVNSLPTEPLGKPIIHLHLFTSYTHIHWEIDSILSEYGLKQNSLCETSTLDEISATKRRTENGDLN